MNPYRRNYGVPSHSNVSPYGGYVKRPPWDLSHSNVSPYEGYVKRPPWDLSHSDVSPYGGYVKRPPWGPSHSNVSPYGGYGNRPTFGPSHSNADKLVQSMVPNESFSVSPSIRAAKDFSMLNKVSNPKHEKQIKPTLPIVDPNTGKDVTKEILGSLNRHNKDVLTEEVKLNKEMKVKRDDIAAQFAAAVAAKLYHSPDQDDKTTQRNGQSEFGKLPKEILNLDSRSIELYNKALQEGEEKSHNIRLMIVGHYGVGKTTLKKRLFKESVDIAERKSTDGIDVHVGRCKVSLNDGKWLTSSIQTDESRKTPFQRLAKLMHSISEKGNEGQAVTDNKALNSAFRRKTTDMRENSFFNESVFDTDSFMSALDAVDQESDDYIRKKVHLEKLIKEVQHDMIVKDETHCDLSLWDFAGQNIFYATHQAFLSRRAVYLLVIDLSRHIDDTVGDDIWHFDCQGEKQCKIADFFEFWLNSIHEFCSCPGESGPPVILVGTFADKMKQRSDADRCFYNLRSSVVKKVTNCHLAEKQFHVDNTISGDQNIEALRKYIVKIASEQSYWGERIPAKWITLEDRLMRLKDEENVKVIRKDKILEENRLLPVPIEKDEEIELFLKFHHESGTFLYFGDDDMKDDILLDPQWLIYAFKSLITAAMFSITKAEIQKKWHEFDRSAILKQDLIELIWTRQENRAYLENKELILKFMEKLGFVAKPKQCTDDSTKIEDYYLVPCMLKDPPPAKVITWNESVQFKSTSKLCLSNAEEAEQRFIPPTVFNKILAAGINQWPLSKQNDKYMIFCGGAIFQLENNHFLYLFLYEHVIQIWISRLSMEGHTPSISLCRKTLIQIRKILAENVRMYRKILSFVKCPKASLYSNENMVPLQEEGGIRNREIPCFCQDEKHVVSYVNISKYWLPEDKVPKPDSTLHLDLERKPTEKDFSRMSRRIGNEFMALAYELGLSQPEIDHICMDNNTTADKITAILRYWSKRMHDQATYRELIKGFEAVGIDITSVLKNDM